MSIRSACRGISECRQVALTSFLIGTSAVAELAIRAVGQPFLYGERVEWLPDLSYYTEVV